MKKRRIMSAILAADMLVQITPFASMTAFADAPAYDILINGQSAAGVVSVTYGEELADLSDEAVSAVACDMGNGVELYAEWSEQTLDIPALTPISKTYDAQEETLSVTLSNTGVLTYQWNKDGAAIEGATTSSLTVKNVADSGSYHVYVELQQADGTVIGSGSSEEVTVDIRRAPLTVKADDDEITYGSDAPSSYSVTISGFVGAEDEEVVTDGTVTCSYEKGDNADEYDIVPAGFSAANYEIDHRNGKLTVKEKTGTLTAQLP